MGSAAFAVAAAGLSFPAHASTFTFDATYFQVAYGTDSDFNTYQGLTSVGPLYNGNPTGTGVNDLGPNNQITWWDPSLNPNVSQTGTGMITTPYANYAMFPPNSTGANDETAFETATFTTTFSANAGETLDISIASDDNSLVYLNGVYIGGDLGVKPIGSPSVFSAFTSGGTNTLEVFYADRQNTQAALVFSAGVVPEPSTWAMMGLGFAGLAFAGYRRATKTAFAAV